MGEKHDDQRLVQLLQKGNVAAFDSLFGEYSQKLYGFALKYFKNQSDAEELVQEFFVKVWENSRTLKSEFSFKSYLFTIALNQIREHFNKKATSLKYLPLHQQYLVSRRYISANEFTVAESLAYPSVIYTILSQGGKWDRKTELTK